MYSNFNWTYYALLELSVINNNNNNISETEAHNEHAQFFKLQGASKRSNIFFPHLYAYDVSENGYHP